jgi:hypothetical protein
MNRSVLAGLTILTLAVTRQGACSNLSQHAPYRRGEINLSYTIDS